MKSTFLFSILGLLILSSCRDTCNNKYGDTFESVLYNKLDTVETTHLYFTTKTLSDLPEAYFGNVNFTSTDTTNYLSLDSVNVTSSTIKAYVDINTLPELNQSKLFEFRLEFEDRRNYLDCKHPGMNDSYILELNGNLINSENQYSLSEFDWKEQVHIGAI